MNIPVDRSVTGLADRVMLWCILLGAASGAVIAAVFATVGLVELLGSDVQRLALVAYAPIVDVGAPVVVASVSEVVVVADYPAVTIALAVGATVVTFLGWLAVCAAAANLARRLLGQAPVLSTIAANTVAAGVALSLTALLAVGLGAFSTLTAADAVRDSLGSEIAIGTAFRLDTVVAGVIIAVLGFVVTLGERFERDAAGLV